MKKFFKKLTKKQRTVFLSLSGFLFLFFLWLLIASDVDFIPVLVFFLFSEAIVVLYYLTIDNNRKKSPAREWVDAIIFAVIAATIIRTFFIEAFTIPTSSMEKTLLVGDFLFVSKVNYGARVPNTPLAFPFAHHTLPLIGGKSYLEWIRLPYFRFPGFEKIKNNDIVVFNYPMEDFRPVDKKENYIKRCVAIPGDTLRIINCVLYMNGKEVDFPEYSQSSYHVRTDGSDFNPATLKKMHITEGGKMSNQGDYRLTLTEENSEKIKSMVNVKDIRPIIESEDVFMDYIFPSDSKYSWNVDNFGPLYIPRKGITIPIDTNNISIYRRVIGVYEHNKLEEKDGKIYINDVEAHEYTFKMGYYFMMGDNRHNSADSRFWGFVPEDHIVGKAVFIWMSWDSDADFFNKIRWSRLFTLIHKN